MRFTRIFFCWMMLSTVSLRLSNFQVYKTQKSDHFFLLTCTISNFHQHYFIRVSINFSFYNSSVYFVCVVMVFKFSLISFVGVKKCKRESSKKEIINFGTHDFFSINRRVDFWPFYASSQSKKYEGAQKGTEKSNNRYNLRSFSAFSKSDFYVLGFSARNSTSLNYNGFLLDSYCRIHNLSRNFLRTN